MEDNYLYCFVKKDDLGEMTNNNKIITEITSKRLKELYGKNIDKYIKERYDYELNQIIENNFANIYMIAYTIAQKAKEDGHIMMLRGSASSSFIAYLLDISFVEPIKYKIPFEIFANLKGDLTPYFEFVFSSNYVADIFQYTKELLDEMHIQYFNNNKSLLTDYHFITIPFLASRKLSILENLEQLTTITHNNISLTDRKLFELSRENITITDLFGFTNQQEKSIINKVNYKDINELVKVFALIYGASIWENNVANLIEKHSINEIACSRDDIFLYLMNKRMPRNIAFEIMQFIRKGKPRKGKINNDLEYMKKWNYYINVMKKYNIPEWYINSLEKIEYMCSKALCYNYVILYLWLSWYKIYYPNQFKNLMIKENEKWKQV